MTGCKEHGQALNPTVIVQYVLGYFWLTDLQFLQLTESTARVWITKHIQFKLFSGKSRQYSTQKEYKHMNMDYEIYRKK